MENNNIREQTKIMLYDSTDNPDTPKITSREKTEYCSDCDYCGEITIVVNDPWGGKACRECLENIESKIEGG